MALKQRNVENQCRAVDRSHRSRPRSDRSRPGMSKGHRAYLQTSMSHRKQRHACCQHCSSNNGKKTARFMRWFGGCCLPGCSKKCRSSFLEGLASLNRNNKTWFRSINCKGLACGLASSRLLDGIHTLRMHFWHDALQVRIAKYCILDYTTLALAPCISQREK